MGIKGDYVPKIVFLYIFSEIAHTKFLIFADGRRHRGHHMSMVSCGKNLNLGLKGDEVSQFGVFGVFLKTL